MKMRFKPGCLIVLMAIALAGVRPLAGQVANAQEAKKITFDVVAIRPSAPDADPYKGGGFGVTADGFFSRIMPLQLTMMQAYFPPFDRTPNPFKNAPAWITDRYDIEAKVAPEDAAEWQRLTRTAVRQTSTPLQLALQTMLAERLKLVVHRVPVEVDGYALVVSKRGAKLKEVTVDEPASDKVVKLQDGAKAEYTSTNKKIPEWVFYQTSMEVLVSFMQGNILKPLVDQTGLKAKYHFVLKGVDPGEPGEHTFDPDGSDRWELEQLGLEIKAVKVPSSIVVIDHIERPSEN